MRNLIRFFAVTPLFAALFFAPGCANNSVQGAFSGAVSGTFLNQASTTISLAMFQNGNTVTGDWGTTGGVGGQLTGTFDSGTLSALTMTGPNNCTISGTGTLNGNTLTITFSSGTCGQVTGTATLTKTAG